MRQLRFIVLGSLVALCLILPRIVRGQEGTGEQIGKKADQAFGELRERLASAASLSASGSVVRPGSPVARNRIKENNRGLAQEVQRRFRQQNVATRQ